MSDMWLCILSVVIAYFIGNISPSILMAKAKGIDIRNEGSGNAGTTNALRVMGKKAGDVVCCRCFLWSCLACIFRIQRRKGRSYSIWSAYGT